MCEDCEAKRLFNRVSFCQTNRDSDVAKLLGSHQIHRPKAKTALGHSALHRHSATMQSQREHAPKGFLVALASLG